jgi:hypothetical protein
MFNGRTPLSYPRLIVISAWVPYFYGMRIAALMILASAGWAAGPELGIWKMNASRSTFATQVQPKSLTLRFEPHAKGTLFTVDRIESDDRATSSSTILYLDGKTRDFEDFRCIGKQSSRRTEHQGLEIVRHCMNGGGTRIEIQTTGHPNELVLVILLQDAAGNHSEEHLVFEKHALIGGIR